MHAVGPLRTDPNGLALERQTGALYVADGASGAILRIANDRQTRLATIDSGGVIAANRLGGVALADGIVYATRVGHGRAGAVFQVANGHAEALPRLAPEAWRVGITYDPEHHVLYTTQFAMSVAGPCNGGIVEIDLYDGHASTLIDCLVEPVGVVKLGASMVVSDASLRAVFRVELQHGRAIAIGKLADRIGRPGAICVAGPDSVLVSCFDDVAGRGSIRQIWLDGRSREIARGTWEPCGIATDGDRAYVSARRANRILVFGLDDHDRHVCSCCRAHSRTAA